MKQARATRLFHVDQFGAWPADLVPLDEKGNPRPRDRHSVAICFTWNKIRVRESTTKGSLERLPYLHETGSSHRTIVPRGTVRCLVRRPHLNVPRETVLPGTKRVQRVLRKRG